jgi:hypothetical protein
VVRSTVCASGGQLPRRADTPPACRPPDYLDPIRVRVLQHDAEGACDLLGWTMLALAWIDWGWLVLPDALTLPVLAGLVVALAMQPEALLDRVLAAAARLPCPERFGARVSVPARTRGREGLRCWRRNAVFCRGCLAWSRGIALDCAAGRLRGAIRRAGLRLAGRRIDASTAFAASGRSRFRLG